MGFHFPTPSPHPAHSSTYPLGHTWGFSHLLRHGASLAFGRGWKTNASAANASGEGLTLDLTGWDSEVRIQAASAWIERGFCGLYRNSTPPNPRRYTKGG